MKFRIPANLGVENRVSYHRTVRTAVVASLVIHGAGWVALATWSTQRPWSPARFGGRSRAIQLTVLQREPQWSPEIIAAETTAAQVPVLIQPMEARIAKRRFLSAPTGQPPETDLIADVEFDVSSMSRATEGVNDLPQIWAQDANPIPSRRDHRVVMSERPSQAWVEPPASLGSADDTPPDLSRNAPPSYPAIAIQRRWQGTVLLRVSIDATGRVSNVAIERTSGYPLLDSAAATAVLQWQAVPARRNGKPVATVELLPVQFRL